LAAEFKLHSDLHARRKKVGLEISSRLLQDDDVVRVEPARAARSMFTVRVAEDAKDYGRAVSGGQLP
jgi:hypothetical protein